MNISQLMPKPYSRFHSRYLAAFRRVGRGRVMDNLVGRTVTGMHKDGFLLKIHLVVTEVPPEDRDPTHRGTRLFCGRVSLPASTDVDKACVEARRHMQSPPARALSPPSLLSLMTGGTDATLLLACSAAGGTGPGWAGPDHNRCRADQLWPPN